MPRRDIVPVAELGGRLPRAGKLKLGQKSGKAMRALNDFRFTSPYRDCLDILARLYGGEVKPWHDDKASPPDQFELLSHADEINVYLVPDGLSTWYELWSAGGCVRRCDGVNVDVPVKVGEHDYDIERHSCLCKLEGARQCDVKTRLNVILPEVPMRGAWLLETKSQYATEELPGMHDLIVALGQRGIVQARLGIEKRAKSTVAGTRRFVVPKLSIVQSALEIQSGMAGVGAIAAAGQAVNTPRLAVATAGELGTGAVDDIADAEIIDDDLLDIEHKLADRATAFGLDPQRFVDAMKLRKDLAPGSQDRKRMREAIQKMRDGQIAALGFTERGTIQWRS